MAPGATISRFARFVRRTGLDELPQLINILRGEMSFIGPRPLMVRYIPRYTAEQRRRHSCCPASRDGPRSTGALTCPGATGHPRCLVRRPPVPVARSADPVADLPRLGGRLGVQSVGLGHRSGVPGHRAAAGNLPGDGVAARTSRGSDGWEERWRNSWACRLRSRGFCPARRTWPSASRAPGSRRRSRTT